MYKENTHQRPLSLHCRLVLVQKGERERKEERRTKFKRGRERDRETDRDRDTERDSASENAYEEKGRSEEDQGEKTQERK